jgi:hypothetical protein
MWHFTKKKEREGERRRANGKWNERRRKRQLKIVNDDGSYDNGRSCPSGVLLEHIHTTTIEEKRRLVSKRLSFSQQRNALLAY